MPSHRNEPSYAYQPKAWLHLLVCFFFGLTVADNHLTTASPGEWDKREKSPRARRHREEGRRRRPEGASFEDSDLGSVRR
ncbi:jg24458 [Pararge aegeria aegeria]|uniref:Jg24458 protein n=1 Tax=Pararge aegeria aegeria TaxID=348720 RepID=A0A8S4RKJ5_9NEOP|nr:jg24458 [Pararge aegeria aegeria]